MATTRCFLAGLALLALVGPLVVPYGYDEVNLPDALSPPSARHWLGTDSLGRDLLARLLYGARVSLAIGLVATLVSLVIGVSYGALQHWSVWSLGFPMALWPATSAEGSTT